MADKEPDNKGRSPWQGPGKNEQQTPPNLDEVVKKFQEKMQQFLGGGTSGGKPSQKHPASADKKPVNTGLGLGMILLLIALIWALSGIYIIKPAEQAVELRFGKYLKTVGPGPHWMPRFINSKYVANVEKISNFSYSARMLNKDENIVEVSLAVQYRIGELENYLFNVVDPEESLRQATASALRQVVGHTTLDDVLTTGRERVRQETAALLDTILSRYETGIVVTDLAMLPARAPDEVKAAFDDAIKAQEDEQRFVNQAQAYAAGVIPVAEGNAARVLEEAEAYKGRTILDAIGNASRFLALLQEYRKSPDVTRDRLYIEALQEVFSKSSKVFLDVPDGSNLLYLPLDQVMQTVVEEVDVEDMDVSQNGSGTSSQTSEQTHRTAATQGAQANQNRYGALRSYGSTGGDR